MRPCWTGWTGRWGTSGPGPSTSIFPASPTPRGGEKCHLTFADTAYGPPHQPLMALFKARGLCPTVICESAGTQAEDAAALAAAWAAAPQA